MNPPVRYPSYVDLDALIDVERLKGLDGIIRDRLERRLRAERGEAQPDRRFYTGPFILNAEEPTLPGSRMVYLARSENGDDYYSLDQCDQWHPSAEADEFPEVMDFIATLPFRATGRMLIIYDPAGLPVTAHRDHDSKELCHEFIWLRTNLEKPFYLLNPETGERRYVAGYSAWFDTVNQYHGADGTGELCWSIRVDGQFTDEFRALMPASADNPSSRAAVWDALRTTAGATR